MFKILVLFLAPIFLFGLDGKVVGVTDGDTIKILTPERHQVKVRLYGIDAPEKKQPYGTAAKRYLSDLIAGKTVQI